MNTSRAPPEWAAESWKHNSCSREDHPYLHKYDEWCPVDPRCNDYRQHEHVKDPKQRILDGEGDGIWKCHKCYQEHLLTLQPGLSPFRKLKCCCSHVACFECYFTNVLQPIPPMNDPTPLDGDIDWEKVPVGGVCPACGVSSRLREYKRLAAKAASSSRSPQTRPKMPKSRTTGFLRTPKVKPGIFRHLTRGFSAGLKAKDVSLRMTFGELICLQCAGTPKTNWLRFRIGDPSDYHAAVQAYVRRHHEGRARRQPLWRNPLSVAELQLHTHRQSQTEDATNERFDEFVFDVHRQVSG